MKPSQTEKGQTAYLAEDAEYDNDQARDAVRRMRTALMSGFAPTPVRTRAGGGPRPPPNDTAPHVLRGEVLGGLLQQAG